jgi:hypothetical protein
VRREFFVRHQLAAADRPAVWLIANRLVGVAVAATANSDRGTSAAKQREHRDPTNRRVIPLEPLL